MTRQFILLSEANDKWLQEQVDKKKYTSKSELVNDLVSHARHQQDEIMWIRNKLFIAENSGFTNLTKEQILAEAKVKANSI